MKYYCRNRIEFLRGGLFRQRAVLGAAALAMALATTAALADDARPSTQGSSAYGVSANARLVETGFGPAPFYTLKDDGADFVAAGSTTRSSTGIAEPFALAMPAIPGTRVKAYVQWNWLLNGAPPPADTYESTAPPLPARGAAAARLICAGARAARSHILRKFPWHS